jgi:hypothetical protein
MTEVKISETRIECLEDYLKKKQKPLERVSTVKLIHKWIPKQGRVPTPSCPRCGHHHEMVEHIYSCPDPSSQTE